MLSSRIDCYNIYCWTIPIVLYRLNKNYKLQSVEYDKMTTINCYTPYSFQLTDNSRVLVNSIMKVNKVSANMFYLNRVLFGIGIPTL